MPRPGGEGPRRDDRRGDRGARGGGGSGGGGPRGGAQDVAVHAKSTQDLVEKARKNAVVHACLELTKFVPWQIEKGGRPGTNSEKAIQNVIKALSTNQARDLARNWLERRRGWLSALGERARRIELESLSPCVLWLAAPTALELGFCLHHTYGLPYLPGSGLKGLARTQMIFALGGSKEDPPAEATALFGEGGDSGHVGRVDFLDGIPLDATCLEPDVMSPHHPNYYQGKSQIPHDCEDPIPLKFLRIRPGARFEIALVCAPGGNAKDLDEAERWLLAGLAELGLGAKTSSGYGLFEKPAGPVRQQAPGVEKAAAENPPLAPAGAERSLVATAVAWEHGKVLFRADDGYEVRLDAEMLEKKFGFKRAGWRDRCNQKQRFRIALVGDKLDDFQQEKK